MGACYAIPPDLDSAQCRAGLSGPCRSRQTRHLGGLGQPPFFNPSLGQKATIEFLSDRAKTVTLTILDRDRFPVRELAARKVASGKTTLTFDGKDDAGVVLSDEAYAVRIGLKSGSGHDVFDPFKNFQPVYGDPKRQYSPVGNALTYELERPSRVHIQAVW
jgi:hypothetical protein